jgi:hypothetical protein
MVNIEIIPQSYCDYCGKLFPKYDLIFNKNLWVDECVDCYRGYS